jgi:predicted aspartyl protease
MPLGRRWFARSSWLAALLAALACETSSADEVPLQVVRNHPFVEVAINGHPTVALLDTGAAASWIDDELAAQLGIGALWLLADEGSGPQIRNDRTIPAGIRIGSDVFAERTLGLIDVDAIFGDLPDNAPMPRAIIGLDVLRPYVIELDFDRSAAEFTPAEDYSGFPPRDAIALERISGLAILRIKLDGLEARSVIDTGATSAMHVSPAFEGAGNIASKAASQTMVSTVAGVHPRPVGALAQVELQGRTFRNVPVTLAMQPLGNGIDAVVGMQLLGQFNLVLDLSRLRMWMTPNNSYGKPFRRDRVGLHTLASRGQDEAPLVLVAPGSPAEKAGFKRGEIVREMRDEAGAKIESGRDVAPGQTVTIVMGDGSSRTLVAAEYY